MVSVLWYTTGFAYGLKSYGFKNMNKFNKLFLTVWKYTLAVLIFADILIEVCRFGSAATIALGILVIAIVGGVVINEFRDRHRQASN